MLSIGQKLQIEPITKSTTDSSEDIYFAKVVSIEDSTFCIEQPINETTNKMKFFFEGTDFSIRFTTHNGGVYHFQTISIQNLRDTVPLIKLNKPKEYERIQRRAFARIDVLTDVEVLLEERFKTTTLNLSGGGMSLLFPKEIKIKENDVFTCKLSIESKNESAIIPITCVVIRYKREKGYDNCKVFVHFMEISEADRSKIVKFCFEKELENRRMER